MKNNTPKFHRRRALSLEVFIVGFVLAAVLFVVLTPSAGASYNHIAACKLSLRGYSSDDDVHALGVRTLARRFIGWSDYWHGGDGSAYVVGIFEYSYGWIRWTGRCTNGDYSTDWFQ